MIPPHTTPETLAALRDVGQRISDAIQKAPADRFFRGDKRAWSAADYLKHLLIAVKPVARVMSRPAAEMIARLGSADHTSRSFSELEALYRQGLERGVRAENYPDILPDSYRLPEGVHDEQTHLVEAWADAMQRLLAGVPHWSEEELDRCRIPHMALGEMTAREMLYFTLIHNRLHAADIEAALQ